MRLLGTLGIGAALAATVSLAACEPDNKNSVGCDDEDCAAACGEQGFASGACVDGECVCDQSSDTYEWDTSTDADTDSDTDTDTDTDSDSDTVTDAGPDAG